MSTDDSPASSSEISILDALSKENLVKFTKFYTLVEAITVILSKKEYKVSPSMVRTASNFFLNDFDQNRIKKSIGFLLSVSSFHKEIKGSDYDFLEKNYLKIFNLPIQVESFGVKELIDPIFSSKKDGVLDVPPIYVKKLFEGLISITQTSINILKNLPIEEAIKLFSSEEEVDRLKNFNSEQATIDWA